MLNLDSERRGYSVDEVARLYRIARQTVYDELNAGRLPSMKIGKRRVITPAHLEAWEKLASGTAEEGAA
jgi:excisionase family DNA binding protein